MDILRFLIRIILLITIINLIACFKIDKSLWSECPISQDRIRTFFGISFDDCAKECLNRPRCKALGHRRYLNVCELYRTEQTEDDKTCVTVRKKDITVDKGEVPCSCKNGETCDTKTKQCVHQECEAFANLYHGQVLGNMYHIGARLMFKCDPGWVEKSLQSSMTCLQSGSWSYTPECVDNDECASNPCKNGATCNNLQNKYTCTCASGWRGTNCDQDIDECAGNPCQNGATCNNLQNKYTCTCAGGWQGTNCDQARCLDKFVIHGEKCYHFSQDTKTYTEAKHSCPNVFGNSYLVEINSKEENDFMAGQASVRNQHYLIGLNDLAEEGKWVWGHSQKNATFVAWESWEPDNWLDNEDCVQLRPNGRWNDIPCDHQRNYICETAAAEEPIPVP
ncbi:neurogenic locus notch homolog protein 2-like isoform X4 [Dreissena polymorpha]|uniref:neurogenic locus notch homolog protein 2-like isoform X4 n=1 Tax=Dreissena polymorpha TaxID=45954 RepID=UPI002263DB48|nr:neurogenic locus notch homolog protein 2-like isoform X4 [Dreissena polymorpha]